MLFRLSALRTSLSRTCVDTIAGHHPLWRTSCALRTSSVMQPHLLSTVQSSIGSQWYRGSKTAPAEPEPPAVLKLTVISPLPTKKLSYRLKNLGLRREMSPHLTVYKVQLTSLLSIMLRFSGIALTLLFCGCLQAYYMTDYRVEDIAFSLELEEYSEDFWTGTRFAIALPVSFHFVNGLRFLFFYFGKCLNIQHVYLSGYVAMVFTLIVAAALTWIKEVKERIDELIPESN